MADEKTRVSGEIPRPEPQEPVLPTVNPEAPKPAPSKSAIHPAAYVAYVKLNPAYAPILKNDDFTMSLAHRAN